MATKMQTFFLGVPILGPIKVCHLLSMLVKKWLVKLFLHELHECQLQVGELGQRYGGDYVRTGDLCSATASASLVQFMSPACNCASPPSAGSLSQQQAP